MKRAPAMRNVVARYTTNFGLVGAFMPDSFGTAREFRRRKDFIAFIREELVQADFPAYAIRQIKLVDLWRHIATRGCDNAHFGITHGAYVVRFQGLHPAEYARLVENEERAHRTANDNGARL